MMMRNPGYITQHFFTHYKLSQYELILNDDKFLPQDKLTAAMELLDIDESKFELIPFIADKLAFLEYKYNLIHFELDPLKFDDEYVQLLEQFRHLARQALNIIKQNPIVFAHEDKYSKYAQGLSSLYQRAGNVAKPTETTEDFTASVMTVGEKKAGVEPGFVAAHHQDIVNYLIQLFQNDENRLIDYINQKDCDIEKMYELIKENLPKYLYKLDYKTEDTKLPVAPGATKVFLTEEDVKRTSNVKKSYAYGNFVGNLVTRLYVKAKESTALDINKEAILETLSNDFASFFMKVQKQKLFVTTHTNGALKIMPLAEWVNGAEEFGSDKMAGGGDDTNNYRARTLLMPRNGIVSLTDNAVKNAARHLIPLLFTGDYDKAGSKGQNLLLVAGQPHEKTGEQSSEIAGIDFGHTLREENLLLSQKCILPDGRFSQPKDYRKIFKNFSALSDGSLSEKMQGVLILAKIKGVPVDSGVIASYGPEFSKVYNDIPSGEANILCDNYIDALQKLQQNDYNNRVEYELYIDAINDFRKRMNTDLSAILDLFADYLHYDAKVLDLADNLNKLCAATQGKTSLRSKDNTHGLNHLLIDKSYDKVWNIAVKDDQYVLSCPFTWNQAESLMKFIMAANVDVCFNNGQLSLSFDKKYLDEVTEIINEQKVILAYHKEDFDAIEAGREELRLQDLVKAPWFGKNNIAMDLTLNPDNKNQYRITINTVKDKSIDSKLANLVSGQFQQDMVDGSLIFDFDIDQISSVLFILESIQETWQPELPSVKIVNNNSPKVLQSPKILVEEKRSNQQNPGFFQNSQNISLQRDDSEVRTNKSYSANRVIREEKYRGIPVSQDEKKHSLSISGEYYPGQASDEYSFKKTLRQLLLHYQAPLVPLEEQSSNWFSGAISTGYGYLRNSLNYFKADNTAELVLFLQIFTNKDNPDNAKKIIELLENRKTYVQESLLNTDVEKYGKEIMLLESALIAGAYSRPKPVNNNNSQYTI